MKKHPTLFVPASFFLTRAPAFPLDFFFQGESYQQLPESLKQWFLEAIAIASPSLKQQFDKNKITPEIQQSLLKYFSRMTSRSTPFGLFSFVTHGIAGDNTRGQIDLNELRKRARPDMEWVQKVIDKICLDPAYFEKLSIQQNPLLTRQSNRFCVHYLRKESGTKTVSVRSSPLTETLFSLTKKTIVIEDLIQQVRIVHPDLEAAKIKEVIQTLIDQEFLWFAILPSLISSSPFKDLLKNVPNAYSEELSTIHQNILDYSVLKPGEMFKEPLKTIEDKMNCIAASKCYLQVDCAISKATLELPQFLLDEVAEGLGMLWQLPFLPVSPMQSYFRKFVTKYGFHRLVHFQELLDETQGLGLPDFDSFVLDFDKVDESYSKFKEWQQEALFNCLWERKPELELTQKIIEKFSTKQPKYKAPPSADVFFEVFADHFEKLEQKDYLILLKGLTQQGGSTFGRFLDMFDNDLNLKLNEFYRQEEALDPRSVFVESSFLPPSARSQNVSINPNFRRLLIDLSPGGKSSLSIDDIYVKASDDRLIITSKNEDIEYFITVTNVLNSKIAPPYLRFLREVSRMKYDPCKLWSWGDLNKSSFLPRVRYKRLILSPALWRVSLEKIGYIPKEPIVATGEKFNKWADDFQMPRYIFVTERDNKLLLDRTNQNHLAMVIRYLKATPFLVIAEKIAQKGGSFLKSQYGRHSAEFVLPLIKHESYYYPEKNDYKSSSIAIPTHIRWKLPGSEWSFIKFFLPADFEICFLTQYLYPFLKYLEKKLLIKQWFFIRYREYSHHIRLRLQLIEESALNQVLTLIKDWSLQLIHEGLIQEIAFSSYEREIERYGGLELISEIESLFCADSATVMDILRQEKEVNLPIHVIGALSIQNMLEGLKFKREAQLLFFEAIKYDKTELSGFREWRKTFFSKRQILLEEAFLKRIPLLNALADKMNILEKENKLTASFFSIISSLIHMHCNRIMGVDQKLEKKARAFAGYALQNPIPISEK